MAITTEQIHQVADQLQAQGIKPTQTNVREALGGGSFTTIAEALRTWRAEQDITAQLQAVIIPQDITDRTQTLTAQIWQTAQALANERLVKEREALAHKEALAIAEVEEAQQIIKTLESEQAELITQLDQLTTQLTTLNQNLETNEAQLSEAEQRATTLEQQLKQALTDKQQLTEKITDQATLISQQLNTITELKTENVKLATNNQHQLQRLEQIEADHKAEQHKSQTHLNDLNTLTTQFANLQGQHKTLADQLTKAENLTQTQAEKIEKLTADLATATAKNTTTTPIKPKTTRTKKEQPQ